MTALYDVVGIGASLDDMIMAADTFPTEDKKVRIDTVFHQCGGPCATALAAVGRLGVSCAYLGTLSDDGLAQNMRREFDLYHVDHSHTVLKAGAASPFSVIITAADKATRTVLWNRGTLPSPTPGEIPADLIRRAKVLHLDGNHIGAALSAAKLAKDSGVKVSIDAGKLYDGVDELVNYVDWFVASKDFSREYTGLDDPYEAARVMIERTGAEYAVITMGNRGGLHYDGKEFGEYPIFDVPVVDSTGCGDVFHGAFITAMLRGLPLHDACVFSSAVSSLKCTKPGGRSGIPTLGEVSAFLRGTPAAPMGGIR